MGLPWLVLSTCCLRRLQPRRSPNMTYSTQATWIPAAKNPMTPAFLIFAKDIQKPEQDDRQYRVIRLENGLQAMLVHDAKADKAAASLDVAVGHLYDPDDMPGLAHFCEHLLFMGTEKFPRENEYSEFLAKNNGASNAYTSTSNTNYYFNVGTPALQGALARFAAFFHCPLFSPSCTSRELNAVDSEHKKNHQSDMWRIFQLNKHLSKHGHVWSKFGTGHRESLSRAARILKVQGLLKDVTGELPPTPPSCNSSLASSRAPSPSLSVNSTSSENDADGGSIGRETRRRLVEWWTTEYCASRMRLCVIGKESLDELSNMVSSLFSPIVNRGRDPLPMINDHPFGAAEMGTLVAVQTIMSVHVVEICFPLGYQPPLWRHKPAAFLAHFVGHEGPGSLFNYLKNKGWAIGLGSGGSGLARGFEMFKITFQLTNEGFRNYRAVVLAAYKYLSLLRSSSFPPWYQKEISTINETKFRFSEKMRPDNYAAWISEHLAWPVDRDLVLSAPQLVQEWDNDGDAEKEVRDILNSLTIDQGRVFIMARLGDLSEVLNRKDIQWEREPWYETPYVVQRFDEDFINEANGPNDISELYLPGPNEFLPTNLDVRKKDVTQPARRPRLVRETPLCRLWYKKDDTFWIPKGQIVLDIKSPYANVSPRASVMTKLFVDLVNDSLTEFAYDADIAGLSYNLGSQSQGTFVMLSGYNDKLPVLTKIVLEKMKNFQVKEDRLEVMKEQLNRSWENFFLGQTYRISDYYCKSALTNNVRLLSEKLQEIPLVTVEQLQEHARTLYSQISMQILVTGNIYKDEAVKIAEMAESILDAAPAETSDLADLSLIIPESSNFIWTLPVPNPNEPNSSLTYYLHIGRRNDARLRVVSSLLAQILAEPTFNILRTKEQLGYVVSTSPWILPGESQFGLRIIVQSERHPLYLEERVEVFLETMRLKLNEMDEREFKEQKNGLERKWREAVKNLAEETNKYWEHIESGFFDFYRRDTDAELLQDVTKDEVLEVFLERIHPASAKRAKLSVHLCSTKPQPKKVSPAALGELTAFIGDERLSVSAGWYQELDEEPTVPAVVKALLQDGSSNDDITASLVKKISELVERYPADSDRKGTMRADAVVIEDMKRFQEKLQLSEKPTPLVEWNDVPVSKI